MLGRDLDVDGQGHLVIICFLIVCLQAHFRGSCVPASVRCILSANVQEKFQPPIFFFLILIFYVLYYIPSITFHNLTQQGKRAHHGI